MGLDENVRFTVVVSIRPSSERCGSVARSSARRPSGVRIAVLMV